MSCTSDDSDKVKIWGTVNVEESMDYHSTFSACLVWGLGAVHANSSNLKVAVLAEHVGAMG